MSPIDPSNLDRDIAAIRARHGDDSIHRGSEQIPVEKIPVPSPALMRITSGGFPLGRMSRIYGGPSSGKSLICWMLTAAAQNLRSQRFQDGLTCCYYNIEKQYDPVFTAARGVNVERLQVLQGDITEEVSDKCELLLGSAHVHILDSRSFATSQDELAAEVGDWTMMLDARVWKKALRRIHNRMDKDENALIFIDHVGTDWRTGVEYASGGKLMDYGSSMSLHLRRGKWLFYDDDGYLETDDRIKEKTGKSMNGLREPNGLEVTARVAKSRVCRPLRSAKMRLDLRKFQFDTTFELAEHAKFFDVNGKFAHESGLPAIAQQTGAKSSWYELADGRRVQGMKGLRLAIEAEPALAQQIYTAMMAGN